MNNFKDLLTIVLDLQYSKYINKKLYICIKKDCKIKSSFNYIYKNKPTYCIAHKLDNMINVISKICQYLDCNIQSSFGYKLKNAIYCKKHSEKDMFNVISKRCKYQDCNIRPNYGLEFKKALYCKQHAEKNMFDVKHQTCEYLDCNTLPSYGLEHNKAIYCKRHAEKNMFDVVSKKCQYIDCNTKPIYGLEHKKPIYCKRHIEKNMFDVINKKCQYIDCKTQPNYGLEFTKALYCKQHAEKNMFDVTHVNQMCKLCKRVRSDKKLENLCSGCFYFTYPNHERTRNHKTKENQIISDLNKEFNNIIIQDKIISGGCSKRRPDGLIKLNDYNIIIEIDEHQHTDYDCENKRLMMLFQDLGNSPLTVIRFNPDKYKKNNETIKSPFGITKVDGKLKIINKKEYNIRLKKLIEIINDNINKIPEKECNIIQLFYN